MRVFICYSNKSSLTGSKIKQLMGGKRKLSNKQLNCDVFIRWGNTSSFNVNSRFEINSLQAVRNTACKLTMMNILKNNNIVVPDFETDSSLVDSFKDTNGKLYIRNKMGEVRYDDNYSLVTDAYYTKPILNKRREYRVHVFNSKILGIYEKVPNLGEDVLPSLFKTNTCRFVRCNPENCRVSIDNQRMCIEAVNSLGLLGGGVDLIRDKDKNVFICEVNSAPGLNSVTLEKWINEIKQFVNQGVIT